MDFLKSDLRLDNIWLQTRSKNAKLDGKIFFWLNVGWFSSYKFFNFVCSLTNAGVPGIYTWIIELKSPFFSVSLGRKNYLGWTKRPKFWPCEKNKTKTRAGPGGPFANTAKFTEFFWGIRFVFTPEPRDTVFQLETCDLSNHFLLNSCN